MATKNIKIHYYFPMCEKNKKTKILELTTLFNGLRNINIEERILKIGEENVQLKRINYDENSHRWSLCFLRNRNDAPFISKLEDEGEAISLDPNEFVGEEVCLIYDEGTKIIALQNNIYSVSFNSIGEFFRQYMDMNKVGKFTLSPITYPKRYTEISDEMLINYKSIIVGFTDIDKMITLLNDQDSEELSDIKVISQLANNLNALNGKIELGVGRYQSKFLQKKTLKSIVEFFKQHLNITKSLKIKMVDGDVIRVIDLINYKVNDEIKINVTKEDPKTFDKILTQMNAKFDFSLDDTIKEIACNITE
ncbi:DUF6731 family protein [Clostridium sp. UBA1056]|uniref:DUF6731 family protein n=1 Tax=unclassified Clostridium TaxID=2614128 RepID=UPI003217FB34